MENIRIMFFGTPVFACSILEMLMREKYNIVAAVCQPDRPVGRKHIIQATPVHAMAEENNIPVLQPEKLKDEADLIQSYEPDLIITCAYGQFIPTKILKMPKYGCLNIHPSLLPKYRGGAPVHHAVMNGDTETGVCLMEMVKEMDAGKVYARCVVPIGEDMTTEELNLELEKAAAQLLKENLPKYLRGELPGEEQDENGVVIARNISREEEQVHFSEEDVCQAYNHIRALIDWPVSYGMIEGKRVKFFKARKEIKEVSAEPGEVLGFRNGAMEIACKGGIVRIQELQPEGKSRMTADAFANGAGRALVGKKFD